jgi:hypothetical protein
LDARRFFAPRVGLALLAAGEAVLLGLDLEGGAALGVAADSAHSGHLVVFVQVVACVCWRRHQRFRHLLDLDHFEGGVPRSQRTTSPLLLRLLQKSGRLHMLAHLLLAPPLSIRSLPLLDQVARAALLFLISALQELLVADANALLGAETVERFSRLPNLVRGVVLNTLR